jgi:hypothetical protein
LLIADISLGRVDIAWRSLSASGRKYLRIVALGGAHFDLRSLVPDDPRRQSLMSLLDVSGRVVKGRVVLGR